MIIKKSSNIHAFKICLFSLFFTTHDIDTAAVVCFSGFSDEISNSSVDNFTFVRNLTVGEHNAY